ncbi:class I SAM-dependent methyltransferase [Polaribacter sp.]|uniref:class I SAM-dependent methyltransferase n=1 Tax=Polaribacter sp. TaxID=1920175 RepID=UPI003EF2B326
MDTTKLYDKKEILYDKFRPEYPTGIVSLINNERDSTVKKIADIGAGTGRLSERFLDQGFIVFAIEPNEKMVKLMIHKYEKFNTFHAINSNSESTGLPNDSMDMVSFGQSFHWCDNPKSIIEAKRILKPSGKILICWNDREKTEDAFNQEFEEILLRLFPLYSINKEVLYDADILKRKFMSKSVEYKEIANSQILDIDGFVGRLESNSYFIQVHKKEFRDSIEQLFIKFKKNRLIKINYLCKIFVINL